jgi:hypothetical protein
VRYNKYTGCNPNAKKEDREGVGRRKEITPTGYRHAHA